MKRRRSAHTWTAERRRRQMATMAAKRRGQATNGVIDLTIGAKTETQRMELAIHAIQTLSNAGRAYVQTRLEEGDL